MNLPRINKSRVLLALNLALALFLIASIFNESFKVFNFSANSPPSQVLKVGSNIWPGYEPIYLARELGHYPRESIRLVEFLSATQVIRAFRNNVIQVAALTMDEVLLLREYGMDVCIILAMDISNGGDAIIGKQEINGIEDLPGKRIGVEHTALGNYFLNLSLKAKNIKVSDLHIISSRIDEHERMYSDGLLDAVVTFEPVKSRLLKIGTKKIFDSSQTPNKIFDVLAVERSALEKYPKELDMLLKGWFKSLDFIKAKPQTAASYISKRMNISDEEVLEAYKGLLLPGYKENLKLMTGSPIEPLAATAKELEEIMLQHKLLLNRNSHSNIVDSSVLKRISNFNSKSPEM